MIVIGISASFFSNYFLLDVGEHNWRWMLGVQVFPALLYLLLLSFIPESPRWLVIKGRDGPALDGSRLLIERTLVRIQPPVLPA